jgi:hypothetical protein
MVRRALRLTLIGYVLMGLMSLALERAGVYGCGCDPDCWCKRPGLNVFRWVLPYWHRGTPGMIIKKRQASTDSS